MEKERKHRRWTKEKVFEAAKECRIISEFHSKYYQAYDLAKTNGWLDEMDWFIDGRTLPRKWTKERVFEAARLYSTRSEFNRKNIGAYTIARKNGWLDEMDWFVRVSNPCKDPMYIVYRYSFKEFNTVYIGITMDMKRRNHQHNCSGPVYNFAKSNNIEVPEMEVLIDGIYQEDALEREGTLVSFCKNIGLNVLNKAKTGVGCGATGGGVRIWTKPSVMEESKKYRTRNEFRKGCPGAYGAARRCGWIDEMVWFIEIRKPKDYWTVERVTDASVPYKTKAEFKRGNKTAYNKAIRFGIINQLFPKVA